MKTYEIIISRVHKGSPYNCSFVIPELQTDMPIDEVINHPEVNEAINRTFGKKLRVEIWELFTQSIALVGYEVEKTKAII